MNGYQRLLEKPWVLLDGAIGTELEKSLPDVHLPWSLDGLVRYPDHTCDIHQRYIASGADVITINGFRTTARTLSTVHWDQVREPIHPVLSQIWQQQAWDKLESELNRIAILIAADARQQRGVEDTVCIAGNIAPLEDCFYPDLSPAKEIAYQEHSSKAQTLKQAGVDSILIETMNKIAEAEGALQAALETDLPVWLSFTCQNGPTVLGGESLQSAVESVLKHLPGTLDAIMVNCTTPEDIDTILPHLKNYLAGTGVRFGAYGNIEAPDPQSVWQRRASLTSSDYAKHAKKWLGEGAWIVGGCCGTTPEDIQLMHEYLPSR
jgi:S-methylmethionine-dependent homocysteine/selenocysteine methylase